MARGSISVFPPIGEDVRSGLYPPTGGSTGTGSDDNFWLYSAGVLEPEPLTTTPLDEFTIDSPLQFYDGGIQVNQSFTITDDAFFVGDVDIFGTGQIPGSPLSIKYDALITQSVTNPLNGPISWSSYTNPWITDPGSYFAKPEGPRGMINIEGTTQWNQADHPNSSGSCPPLFQIWYTYKNAAGETKDIGSNEVIELTYQVMADGATVACAAVPNVTSPNIAPEYIASPDVLRGYWGWLDNPFYGAINGGTLNAGNAESVGFWAQAMFCGDVTWGDRFDVMLRECSMTEGLGASAGDNPTLARHVGVYMQPFTAATLNYSAILNNTVRFFDLDRTFTASPFTGIGGMIGTGNQSLTLNYTNPSLNGFFIWTAKITLQQSADSAGLSNTFADMGWYRNKNGSTAHLAGINSFYAAPVFIADGATITMQSGTQRAFYSSPAYSIANAGAFSGTVQFAGVESDLTVNASVTVTNRYGVKVNNATGAGSLTNQYGVYVGQLTKGGTVNWGVYSQAPVAIEDGTAAHGQVSFSASALGPLINLFGNTTDANAKLSLTSTSLSMGPGGGSATDVSIARTGSGAATVTGTLTTSTFKTNDLESASLATGQFILKDFGSNTLGLRLYKTSGDTQAQTAIGTGIAPGVFFGPGGSTASDINIYRSGTATATAEGAFTFSNALAASSTLNVTGVLTAQANALIASASLGTKTADFDIVDIAKATAITMNAANANLYGVWLAPTVTFTTAPGALQVAWVGYNEQSTFQGSTGATNTTRGFYTSYAAASTFATQDTNARTFDGIFGFSTGPTLTVAASGAMTVSTLTQYYALGVTAPTGATITTYRAFHAEAPTATGTISTYVALDVDAATTPTKSIGIRCAPAIVLTATTVSVASNAGTVPVTCNNAKFTNSSAANMTVTMAVTNATDGQVTEVRIFDATAVTKTITWVNTENGYNGAADITPPANSKGSTTLPTYARFMFNGATSKWTCISV